jgi:hypothetical protein
VLALLIFFSGRTLASAPAVIKGSMLSHPSVNWTVMRPSITAAPCSQRRAVGVPGPWLVVNGFDLG